MKWASHGLRVKHNAARIAPKFQKLNNMRHLPLVLRRSADTPPLCFAAGEGYAPSRSPLG
jgi:hypothetical protein